MSAAVVLPFPNRVPSRLDQIRYLLYSTNFGQRLKADMVELIIDLSELDDHVLENLWRRTVALDH